MTNHTRPARGAIAIALAAATAMVACKSNDETESAEDYETEWRIHGAVDPDSIPEPATAGMSSTEFLEANKLKDGVVTLPSGLQYRVIDQGNGTRPELEDSVLVHYKMINLDGELLDNSRDWEGGKPQEFRVAKVIGGWREALMRMPEGSRWKLYVPSDLAYGSTGIAGVRPNEALIYEIELFKVISAGSPPVSDLGGDDEVSLDPAS